MLSYQHAYHAGCLADVHKHALLSVLLTSLTQKDRPISYIETHAGRGVYDLTSEESLKTGEAQEGIQAILKANVFQESHPYRQALSKVQKRCGETIYAGSPGVARALLRPQDNLHLMELHPQEIPALRRSFRDENVHIHFRDGYEGALALSPPKARRGLILIDPSYEVKTEYQDCVDFVQKVHKKWPEAVITLWYPMLNPGYNLDMVTELNIIGFKNVDHRSFQYARPKDTRGIFGTGLYIINTPWGVSDEFDKIENALRKFL